MSRDYLGLNALVALKMEKAQLSEIGVCKIIGGRPEIAVDTSIDR